MTSTAKLLAQTLSENGIRFVFGVPSGNMIEYMEAFRAEDDLEFILTSHESAAAFMATVYGRLTGKPGLCFGTFGPGATNLSTGVGCALLDRDPLIAFTDEMPRKLRNRTVQMNIDHQQLFKTLTKWTTRLNQKNIQKIVQKAFSVALSEQPGPVHIGLPSGIAAKNAKYNNPLNFSLPTETEILQNPDLPETVIQLIKNSAKPIIAVGLTATRFNIKNKLIKVAEELQAPVVLTPMAKGMFPENHPLYAGVLFHALSNLVNQICAKADLVIGVGYDPVEYNYEDWMPKVPLIHFDTTHADVDPEKIPFVSDVRGNLKSMLDLFSEIGFSKKTWNIKSLIDHKNNMFEKLTPATGTFGPLAVVNDVRERLPEEGILTVDVGAHLHLIGQQWKTPQPKKLLLTNGWSSMGFAIPAAISAKLCYPALPVVAMLGDGGFFMTLGELATLKRLNLKIIVVLISDNSLSLIRLKQARKNLLPGYGTDLKSLPEQPTNHYFGIPVIRAQNRDEFIKALDDAFVAETSVVIEAVVDNKEYDRLVLPGFGHIE